MSRRRPGLDESLVVGEGDVEPDGGRALDERVGRPLDQADDAAGDLKVCGRWFVLVVEMQ